MTARSEAEDNDARIRTFIADWQRRDTDAILGSFTDDAVYHCMPLTPISGQAALAAWVRGFERTTTGADRGAPPGRVGCGRDQPSAPTSSP